LLSKKFAFESLLVRTQKSRRAYPAKPFHIRLPKMNRYIYTNGNYVIVFCTLCIYMKDMKVYI